jgi:hypothetical protein
MNNKAYAGREGWRWRRLALIPSIVCKRHGMHTRHGDGGGRQTDDGWSLAAAAAAAAEAAAAGDAVPLSQTCIHTGMACRTCSLQIDGHVYLTCSDDGAAQKQGRGTDPGKDSAQRDTEARPGVSPCLSPTEPTWSSANHACMSVPSYVGAGRSMRRGPG